MRLSVRILATEHGRMVVFDKGVGRGELSPSKLIARSRSRPGISIKIYN